VSNSIFPTLPGLQFPVRRSAVWRSTKRRTTASGRRFAVTNETYPIWRYTLSFEFLRRDATFSEYDSLVAFFNQHRGGWDTFLYLDPDDNAVTNTQFGIGDGATRQFAATRSIGGIAEPVGSVVITQVTVNGTPTTSYVVDDGRIINFNAAPAASAVLRWTGSYYQRCAFVDDSMDLEKFMAGLWSADGVTFETVKG
jgi:hypothetical protein